MNELLALRETLLNEILMAREMFEHYFTLYNAQVAYSEEVKFADVFFAVSIQALLECSALRLCKMYDKNKQSFSVWAFIRNIEEYANEPDCKNKAALMAIHATQIELLHDISPKLTLLRKLRNKALAHNDLDYFACDDIWSDIGLTIKDYRDLLDLPLKIINDYNMLLDKPYEQLYHFSHQSEGILEAIKHYLKCDSILDN